MSKASKSLKKYRARSLNDAERDAELLREKVRCFIRAMARQVAREEYLKPCASSAEAMIRLKSMVFIGFSLSAGTSPRDKLCYIE